MKCKKLISHISGNHRVINYIEEKATQIVFHLDSFTSFDRNSKDNISVARSHLGFPVKWRKKFLQNSEKFCIVLLVFFKELEKKT